MDKELIKQQRLSNSTTLLFYDHTLQLVGDRWLVKIECEAAIPMKEELMADLEKEDPETLKMFRKQLGATISFSVFKERNFVAESDLGTVRDELIDQVCENMASYLGTPLFPKKLVASRFEQFKKISLLKQLHTPDTPEDDLDEDDGPVDFSACFKD